MTSVRMLAAGAVALFALPVLTAPVRACDDRYIKKCEAESEAAFRAEQQGPTAITPKRRHVRVRTVTTGSEEVRRPRAPRFVAKRAAPAPVPEPKAEPRAAVAQEPEAAPPAAVAQDAPAAAAPESPMARRFRGFINPQPMVLNVFEDLRRPRLAAEHLTPLPAIPVSDMNATASREEIAAADVAAPFPVKVEPDAPPPSAAEPFPVLAQSLDLSPDRPGGFPFHKLILTICAALGAASALRFIVRA